jgi:hypothetical protein
VVHIPIRVLLLHQLVLAIHPRYTIFCVDSLLILGIGVPRFNATSSEIKVSVRSEPVGLPTNLDSQGLVF